jgi:hypothetical protein
VIASETRHPLRDRARPEVWASLNDNARRLASGVGVDEPHAVRLAVHPWIVWQVAAGNPSRRGMLAAAWHFASVLR